jgi:uracil-DNA glycosylase family protein
VATKLTLSALRTQAAACTACPLYKSATQTVFGVGPSGARIMLVGEQPGDHEDIEGLPFVGPAGALLDRALVEAGIDRRRCYVTNAVKHFKWEPRGKRRIHKTPAQREIVACRRWLLAELQLIRPAVLVCLGATAAKAVFGPDFQLMRQRGEILTSPLAARTLATIHPSAVLRIAASPERAKAFAALVADLRIAQHAQKLRQAAVSAPLPNR